MEGEQARSPVSLIAVSERIEQRYVAVIEAERRFVSCAVLLAGLKRLQCEAPESLSLSARAALELLELLDEEPLRLAQLALDDIERGGEAWRAMARQADGSGLYKAAAVLDFSVEPVDERNGSE